MKKTRLIIVVLLLTACAPQTGAPNVAPTQSIAASPTLMPATSTSEPTPIPGTKENPVPLGNALLVDDMSIQVTGFVRPAPPSVGLEGYELEANDQIVLVQLSATCLLPGTEICNLVTYSVVLLGDNNLEAGRQLYAYGHNGIGDAEISGGESVSGEIPFLIKNTDTGFLFSYVALNGESFYLVVG